jgi:uncharacterized protein YdhG (YjbR/CyaY superfamily)
MATSYQTVAEYLAAQAPPARAALVRVRAIIRKALPSVTEGISYQMPVFRLEGAMVLFVAGYARFYSIYPATPHVVRALGGELAAHKRHRATLRFALDEPVPARLIARIAKLRAAEVAKGRKPKRVRRPRSR